MTKEVINAAVIAAETEDGQRVMRERAAKWARKDLPKWHRAIKRRAALGDRICGPCDLRMGPVRHFMWTFGVFNNRFFREAYVESLRIMLGGDFSVAGYDNYGEGCVVEIKW